MTLKNIAIAGMTVEVDPTTVVPPGTVVATIVVAPPTGTKVTAGGGLVHRDGDKITVSAITVTEPGATIPDPGPYDVAFSSTAAAVKAEGIEVLLEGDQTATINATPQIPGTPPTNYPVSFKCKVSAAGQDKVKAD